MSLDYCLLTGLRRLRQISTERYVIVNSIYFCFLSDASNNYYWQTPFELADPETEAWTVLKEAAGAKARN